MLALFDDLEGLEIDDWEICFELRINRARYIRIYADVLVITEDKVFSEVIPALVLTKAEDLYVWEPLPDSTAALPTCSGDMLFNLFDEYMGFLE